MLRAVLTPEGGHRFGLITRVTTVPGPGRYVLQVCGFKGKVFKCSVVSTTNNLFFIGDTDVTNTLQMNTETTDV
jgi:hypothetical protein